MESKVLKKRGEIQDKDKWAVNEIYSCDEEWEREYKELQEEAPKLKNFEGKLGDAKVLEEYFEVNEKISRKAEKIYVYAHLRSDEDTSNTTYQAMMNKIDAYMAEYATYTAYVVPEILALPDGTIEKLMNENKGLEPYKFLIENILKEKPHVLDKKEEELLAAASDCLDAPSSIHNIMTNADMKFGNIKDEDGEEVELTEGNYSSFIKSKDRNVRKAAFERLFGEYKSFENTLATTLSSSIKVFNFGAKIRNYNSALEASLKPNDIPTEVYTNAVKTINDNLSSLHRYVKLKKKLLGLEEMHMYDLYVPVIEVPKEHVEFDKAVEMAVEGLNPLGKEYLDIFQGGINGGWIDKYINKGKRGGAYSWGGYDTKPYVLLNYNYELNDVSTLVHEMGHSIHSYYSRKEQSYYYAGYTLFCAEVASTTNEALLIHHLINKETDKKKKLYLINQELEQIRTTVFRQLMFAEFELYTHESFEKGLPLTAQDYNAKWHELNVKYFGPDMVVDSDIDVEWSRIPHFYSDFYVYQYATGYSAAIAISRKILSGDERAKEGYFKFLSGGSSMNPIDLLRLCNVDMAAKEPIESALKLFGELLDEMEEML